MLPETSAWQACEADSRDMSEVIPPPIDAAVDVESPMAIVRTIIIEIKVQTHLCEIKLAVPNDMANAPLMRHIIT